MYLYFVQSVDYNCVLLLLFVFALIVTFIMVETSNFFLLNFSFRIVSVMCCCCFDQFPIVGDSGNLNK